MFYRVLKKYIIDNLNTQLITKQISKTNVAGKVINLKSPITKHLRENDLFFGDFPDFYGNKSICVFLIT